jgi:hypothetical protein
VPEITPIMPHRKKRAIPALELKRIIIDIHQYRVDVSVRFRLVGQLWQDQFTRVVNVTDDRVLLSDETHRRLISLDLKDVIQFEIDGKFREIEPNFHYDIVLFLPTGVAGI